jgi:hypothetical protein
MRLLAALAWFCVSTRSLGCLGTPEPRFWVSGEIAFFVILGKTLGIFWVFLGIWVFYVQTSAEAVMRLSRGRGTVVACDAT